MLSCLDSLAGWAAGCLRWWGTPSRGCPAPAQYSHEKIWAKVFSVFSAPAQYSHEEIWGKVFFSENLMPSILMRKFEEKYSSEKSWSQVFSWGDLRKGILMKKVFSCFLAPPRPDESQILVPCKTEDHDGLESIGWRITVCPDRTAECDTSPEEAFKLPGGGVRVTN